MRQITESESTPKADGFYMPAEFAPQDRVFMGWPNRPDTFAFGAVPAQRTYAGIANAISEFTPVVMCCNEADYDNCKAVFKDNERVTVMEMSINDAWFRDTGATFLVNGKGDKAATDWHFNAYGGLVDGLYFPWDKDAKIARKMADYVGVRTYRPDHVILEGGSITVDGEGTLIVTDSCLLSGGRTASVLVAHEPDAGDWPLYPRKYEPFSEELRAYMTKELEEYLGVEKVIWVKEGIDPEVTNGHIDDCATFIAPGVVACIWTDDPDYPFYRQCHEIYDTLVNATDAKGRKLKVYKLPMPEKPCFMSDEDVAALAKKNGTTRATASMDKAAGLDKKLIFAIGNAPTALVRLYELIEEGKISPELIIGVPVGFVNVVQSKELIMHADVPYIVAKGRKGGSNIAACIVNALLYMIDNRRD